MPDVDGLLTPPDVQRLLREHGLAPRRSAGQNFVVDPNTVRRIVDAADLEPDDTVLEIGPGLGSLTRLLVQRVARVVAVEIDTGFVELLAADVGLAELAGEVELVLVHGDALSTDVAALLPGPTRVVANLPYNVATPIVMTMLAVPQVVDQLVMVQKEVAQRWAAGVGSPAYGAVSVKLALAADVEVAFPVSRQVFLPVPNVDSVMVAIRHRDDAPAGEERRHLFAVVDAAFAQRRKTLRNNLRAIAGTDAVVEACLVAGVDPGARADACTPEQLTMLAVALQA